MSFPSLCVRAVAALVVYCAVLAVTYPTSERPGTVFVVFNSTLDDEGLNSTAVSWTAAFMNSSDEAEATSSVPDDSEIIFKHVDLKMAKTLVLAVIFLPMALVLAIVMPVTMVITIRNKFSSKRKESLPSPESRLDALPTRQGTILLTTYRPLRGDLVVDAQPPSQKRQ